MATPADDGGYDTDTVSLTSTVEEVWPEDKVWDADAILAETLNENGEPEYLVQWRDFPMDQCTWEPYEHIVDSVLPDLWDEKKREWGYRFEAENARSIKEHRKAQRDAEKARTQRKTKRAKKRNLMQQRTATKPTPRTESDSDDDIPLIRRSASERARKVVEEKGSDDSDDDVPLAALTRISLSQKRGEKPETGQDIETAPNRNHKEPVKQRKGPFVGSSSSTSEASEDSVHQDSDDSLMEEFKRNAANKSGSRTRVQAEKGQSRRTSLQTSAPPTSKAARPTNASKALRDTGKPGSGQTKQASKISHSTPSISRQKVTGTGTLPNVSVARKPGPAPAQIRRSVPGAIKMVNKAVVPVRKEWQNSSKPFKTLKMAHSANKRGNRERDPDISQLSFVNGSPETKTTTRPQSTADANPYGRRDSVYRRVQEHSDDERVTDSRALAPWEKEKVPLICFEYRNNSCRYDALNCRFLHRQGDEFPLAPLNGAVPPKYKKPRPITCWYYMEDPNGCKRTADDCTFAHYNTGLLGPEAGTGGQPVEIDPLRMPKTDELLLSRNRVKTCWYYMEDPNGCSHPAEECKFAHYNTGILAHRGAGDPFQTIEIDPLRRPRSEHARSQQARPEQGRRRTCWYYMEHPGGCRRTENQCAFAHYNTGLLAAKSGGMAMEIDPSLQPKSEQTTSTRNIFTFDKKSQTCFFWAQGTCKKPAEKCKYAHYHTGAAPQPPPNWKDQFGGTPLGFDTPTSMETPAAEDWPALVSAPPTYACAEMKKMIEDTCKLDFVKMFTFNETSRGLMDRRAFLIYHPDDHAEELELVTRWLLMSHVEIFNFWMPGSWDAFKDAIFRGGSGVIIVHDLILAPLKDIPDFGKLLRGNDIRVWCVGHQDPDYYIPLVSPAWIPQEYNCIEVFPMGGVIVMTDDVFEKNPVEALNIVTKFIEKVDETQKFDMPFECGRSLLDRYVAWRLIVRPGIMQWLYDWCIAHEKQCEAKEPHAQAIMDLYFLLHDTGYCNGVDPDAPFLQLPPAYWPIISERPVIFEEYFTALQQSQNTANRFLVSHYADWMLSDYRNYRHLIIVHPHPEGWEDEIPLIDEVMTPQKCMEHFEQPAIDNRFDFWEWAYDPLEEAQES